MSNSQNIIGSKFNRLRVVSLNSKRGNHTYYNCICDCGTPKVVRLSHLKSNKIKSCGCLNDELKRNRFRDLEGKRFGRLLVLGNKELSNNGSYKWECLCDCGNVIKVEGSSLTHGHTKSCGCLKTEKLNLPKSHGMTGTGFYFIWRGILNRCNVHTAINYKDYGGRGIKCEWKSFEEFRDDMYESYLEHIKEYGKENTTIDRIDVNKGYCKENCKWSTRKEQNRNKRSNITLNGKCVSEIAELLCINCGTLRSRLYRNKSKSILDVLLMYNTEKELESLGII